MEIGGRLTRPIALVIALSSPASLIACGKSSGPSGPVYRSALTGEECVPDPTTLMPTAQLRSGHHGRGGHRSPTGIPGDNLDDRRSGHVDCFGDGDSGQGNDRERCGCRPPPGCDAEGCCEVPPPEPTPDGGVAPEPEPDPGDEPI